MGNKKPAEAGFIFDRASLSLGGVDVDFPRLLVQRNLPSHF
jgi:hypothetical protein